jgi:hypothetical protein
MEKIRSAYRTLLEQLKKREYLRLKRLDWIHFVLGIDQLRVLVSWVMNFLFSYIARNFLTGF